MQVGTWRRAGLGQVSALAQNYSRRARERHDERRDDCRSDDRRDDDRRYDSRRAHRARHRRRRRMPLNRALTTGASPRAALPSTPRR